MNTNFLVVIDSQTETQAREVAQEDTSWVTIDVSYRDLTPDPTEEDGYYDGCEESQFD